MDKSSFGVIGLGVMGKSLALNLLEKGHSLSVFNRSEAGEENLVVDFMATAPVSDGLKGFNVLKDFILSLEVPRKILLMIKSGEAIDLMVDLLLPSLEAGDVIIDGGNSHFRDTINRSKKLANLGVHFIGCGISGGEDGARNGPSIMPGGSFEGYQKVSSTLLSIAARGSDHQPCCAYIGSDGAGHYVKMIHNGIEYAEMQLLAEAFHLLSLSYAREEIKNVFMEWNRTSLSGYLLEITIEILQKREESAYLLDLILDQAGNKGTGSWSAQSAMELGVPTTLMTDAVFARYISSFKVLRTKLTTETSPTPKAIDVGHLKQAYQFARWINHIQGFSLLSSASAAYQWDLDLSTIARIWTNGCIIRSHLMEELVAELAVVSEELMITQKKRLQSYMPYIKNVLTHGVSNEVALPVFSSAYQYWLGMTTSRLPANLIQAQRDYFGAHTYQRVDKEQEEYFHTNWKT